MTMFGWLSMKRAIWASCAAPKLVAAQGSIKVTVAAPCLRDLRRVGIAAAMLRPDASVASPAAPAALARKKSRRLSFLLFIKNAPLMTKRSMFEYSQDSLQCRPKHLLSNVPRKFERGVTNR